uniref:Keratinocyte-associated protein 2-like n=1 Tax=Dermatophagoides pteronyssinus TaxID=6956 RepID=A0A6P6XSF2_DERPT|nr:keratinocyte-associated protein 2-like [Dermatophagoides pteronyssinus]
MAVSLGLSCIISSSLSLVIMAAMQIFRSQLIETKLLTLFAGYLGSLIFIFILTAVNNVQMSLFGKHYQSKYTEVIFSLIVAMFTSGLVHQVAVTSCLLFSLASLYFLNIISSKTYQSNNLIENKSSMKQTNVRKKK